MRRSCFLEHVNEGVLGRQTSPTCILYCEARQQVTKKFLASAPASEVVHKKDLHGVSAGNRQSLFWISYNFMYFIKTAWASMTEIVNPAVPSASPRRTKYLYKKA
jgi:hypothetical protein